MSGTIADAPFRAVMGNHERLMLDALSPDGNVNNWLMNGGQWFFMLDTDQEILAGRWWSW